MTASQTQLTDFTKDVVGRYVCNGLDEALHSADPAGSQPDARPFDVIGGGSFGPIFAEHFLVADKTHSHHVLVLEGGPLSVSEHVQNLPMIGASRGRSSSPRGGIGLAVAFLNLAYTLGGRSVFFGGWAPGLLGSETTTSPPNQVSGAIPLSSPDLPLHLDGIPAAQQEIAKKNPDIDLFDRFRHATDTTVVITIRGIGEMQPHNPGSRVTLGTELDEYHHPRAQVDLTANAKDKGGVHRLARRRATGWLVLARRGPGRAQLVRTVMITVCVPKVTCRVVFGTQTVIMALRLTEVVTRHQGWCYRAAPG